MKNPNLFLLVVIGLIKNSDQEVVFQCRDEGPLRARVKWVRENNRPLPSGSRDINGRLEMPEIKVEHGGTYICQVFGSYSPSQGEQTIPVHLKVNKWARPQPPPRPECASPFQTRCANGECINKSQVCNNVWDCTDGSDESRCNPDGSCDPNEFTCSNKKCVLVTWVCDGDDDCGDGSDEQSCPVAPPNSTCQNHQFECANKAQCIPKGYHCDMDNDCTDGSDEWGCASPVISRPPQPMVTLPPGETFTVNCTAVGVPVPQIVWRLNWKHIPEKCSFTNDKGTSVLTCPDIQEQDQGAYSCESINIKGSKFATPDTILIVQGEKVCRLGYFNAAARDATECIKCFCFGHAVTCRSADLYIFQLPAPFATLNLLGVSVNPNNEDVQVRDEPIYRGVKPSLNAVGRNGVQVSLPPHIQSDQDNLYPYFTMPENYHGPQLNSYGGYLRYNIEHSNRGYPSRGPDVILSGKGYTLLHESRQERPREFVTTRMEVRFFAGEWMKVENGRQKPATREEIMMTLANVENILLKVKYNEEGQLNTTIRNIEMDSAASPNLGLGAASYVEECSCPAGYTGHSCEKCTDGFVRSKNGPWLGQCIEVTRQECQPGEYGDPSRNIPCEPCPCPFTNPGQQFARTCSLHSDGDVLCHCQPGYQGRRCEVCAPGYQGNPLSGGTCTPETPRTCSAGAIQTADGRCECKLFTTGPTCSECKPNSFHLSSNNDFGCIPCHCMDITGQCSSSTWFREKIYSQFARSNQEFNLVEKEDLGSPLPVDFNATNRAITYGAFQSSKTYYWSLPSRYLGNKITAYGGKLRYKLKHSPVPGGQSSRNSAPDVLLVSADNNIKSMYFSKEQPDPSNQPQTFEVPMFEQYWQRHDGQNINREHLLATLADLSGIYIKATYYTNTREASLIEVSLEIAVDRNTGLERAYAVEQCQCPAGYKGLSCEDCNVGYSRIISGQCKPCECNGNSNECDPDSGECKNCRNNTTGDSCEDCLPGYDGDALVGDCRPSGGPQIGCRCDPRGSLSTDCSYGTCRCKNNVEGPNCDTCKSNTFGLSANKSQGCDVCFCFGINTYCVESNLYVEQIPSQIFDESQHGFILTDMDRLDRINSNFQIYPAMNEISYTFGPGERTTWFWSLPSPFTGNHITSYGGRLEFTQRYTQYPGGRHVQDRDVIINGRKISLIWTNPNEKYDNNRNLVSVVLLPEGGWRRIDQTGTTMASREDLLTALSDIDSILIRASQSSKTESTFISDLVLDTAVEQPTTKGRATYVEKCGCPKGYRGTSCESCASGYYRDVNDYSQPLGSCKRCPCNGNEQGCSVGPDGVVQCHCKPGYGGQQCLPGPANDPGPIIITTPAPPTILVSISTPAIAIFAVGGTVRYNCSAQSVQYPRTVKVIWNKEDTPSLPDRAIDNGKGILTITDLRETDSGNYICEAYDGYNIVTSHVKLVVGGPANDPGPIIITTPAPPTILVSISTPAIAIFAVGGTVRYNCSAQSVQYPRIVKVLWNKEDTPSLPDRAIDNGKGILTITDLRETDSGNYICEAYDGYNIVTSHVKLVVGGPANDPGPIIITTPAPPTILVSISTPAIAIFAVGGTVRYNCSAQSVQYPRIVKVLWNKEDTPSLPDRAIDNGKGILTITDLRETDSGNYICEAYDGYNIVTSHVKLVVGGKRPGEDQSSSNPGYKDLYPRQRHHQRVVSAVGRPAQLKCRVDNRIEQTDIIWLRGNNSSIPREAYIKQDTLYFDNAQPSSAGKYKCIGLDSQTKRELFMFSWYLDIISPPRITLDPVRQVVSPGQDASIQCTAVGDQPMQIWWTPMNRSMPSSVTTKDGFMQFSRIQFQDQGRYVCRARNSAGEADATADVIVEGPANDPAPDTNTTPAPPTILVSISTPGIAIFAVGGTVRYNCSAKSMQYPRTFKVLWNKEDTPSLPDRAIDDGKGILTITDLRETDSGNYICKAYDDYNIVTIHVKLVVGENVQGPVIIANKKQLRAYVGTNTELRCQAQDPNARIKWYRESTVLPINSRVDRGSLTLYNVQPEDGGRYYCEIEGEQSNDFTDLIIVRPALIEAAQPTLDIYPTKEDYRAGETVQISCHASEKGVITTWSKPGSFISENVKIEGSNLIIYGLRRENGGRYRCEATGYQGVYHKDQYINVIEEHKDEPKIQTKTAVRGTTILLDCNVTLPSPITYLWTKQGGQLPQSVNIYNRSIIIHDVGSSDAGTYICAASSGNQKIETPIKLTVTGIVPYFAQAPNSYISLPTLPDAFAQFSFEISFKPENGHGLILYNGEGGNDRSKDFISLSLVNSVPEFKYSLDQNTVTVLGDRPISNRQWHTVKIVRNRRKVLMYVDGEGPFIGNAAGRHIGLSLKEPLYLGGVPNMNQIHPDVKMDTGFVGCISLFKNGQAHWDIQKEAIEKYKITSCETCAENKCQNNGVCQENLSKEGYTCLCSNAYSGPTCNKPKGQACSPMICGSGKCVDTEASFECHCPIGYSGPRCEKEITVIEPSFKNNAYIAYPAPKIQRHIKIMMKFKPKTVEDGILFYVAETEEKHGEFLSLAIKDKHLEFRFDAGSGMVLLRQENELVPDEWAVLTATRFSQMARLVVNGASVIHNDKNRKVLNLFTPAYVGGYDKARVKLNSGVGVEDGFNGCISQITISGMDDPSALVSGATDASNVEQCMEEEEDFDNNIYTPSGNTEGHDVTYTHTGCSSNPCQHGECFPLSPVDYQCSCKQGYSGKNCDILNSCQNDPCKNGGTCRETSSSYTCDCLLGYTGGDCDQRTELRNDVHFDGAGYLEFSKELLEEKDTNTEQIIAMELSTNHSNGLIFWHGQKPNEDGQGKDYISLALVNGYLEYSYDLGSGPAIIRNSKVKVDDNERHSVILKRLGQRGSIEIDHQYMVDGESEGLQGFLNAHGNIYLGGTPNIPLMTSNRVQTGFVGCIHGFELQESRTIDLGVKAINGVNAKPCSSSRYEGNIV